jgi:hypothetical protein
LNRPGVAAQYNIRPPSGPQGLRTTDTHKLGGTQFRSLMLRLGYRLKAQKTKTHSTRYLSNKWISRILLQSVTTPTSQREMLASW